MLKTKARATHMPKHDHEIEPVRPSAGGHPYRQRTKQWPGAHASGSHSANDTMQTSLPGDNQRPLGLENLGNTCFLNSVVQCLASTPPVARMCREHIHSSNCTSQSHHCIGCALEPLLIDLCPHDGPTSRRRPTPGALVRLTANVIASHTPGQQEDAHEFLRELLDKVHSTMPPDVGMQHIFVGQLHSQTFCSGCGARPPKRENFLDLSLEIGAEATVRGSLERFAAVEHLCGNEKYACGVCDARVDARKQLRVHAPPQVLVLHLKRFGFDVNTGRGTKLDQHVRFDERVELAPFCTEAYNASAGDTAYELYALIVHEGKTMQYGHYYCFVKTAGVHWHKCNDDKVAKTFRACPAWA